MKLIVNSCSTLSALNWIRRGWWLFTLQPKKFMVMTAIILLLSLMANIAQILSILIVFIMPFLNAGYYQAASNVEKQQKIEITDLFYYLSNISEYRIFLKLALVGVGLSIPLTSSTMAIIEQVNLGQAVGLEQLTVMVLFMALNFMLLAFAVPAAWIAPDTSLVTLLQQSFVACWKNAMPLTLYGLLIFVISLVCMPIILIGWLVAFSLGSLSFYQMFLDIYKPETADEGSVMAMDEPDSVITDSDEQATTENTDEQTDKVDKGKE